MGRFLDSLKGLKRAVAQIERSTTLVARAGILPAQGSERHPSSTEGSPVTVGQVAAILEYRDGGDKPMRRALATARPQIVAELANGVQKMARGNQTAEGALMPAAQIMAQAYRDQLTSSGHVVTGTTVGAVSADVVPVTALAQDGAQGGGT